MTTYSIHAASCWILLVFFLGFFHHKLPAFGRPPPMTEAGDRVAGRTGGGGQSRRRTEAHQGEPVSLCLPPIGSCFVMLSSSLIWMLVSLRFPSKFLVQGSIFIMVWRRVLLCLPLYIFGRDMAWSQNSQACENVRKAVGVDAGVILVVLHEYCRCIFDINSQGKTSPKKHITNTKTRLRGTRPQEKHIHNFHTCAAQIFVQIYMWLPTIKFIWHTWKLTWH